ncbi:aminoglycoside phosphotransferase family protein [Labrenzia sp. DG1229]|uniref:phosphotransferase enzyme family protein n=1 Tax=Labrenzia sp. DG1229 TaxID=681847 RepID=UPI00048AAE93|nr:aminoglycoside phosphotransferase family protein [Labrenzia sp. DG1229]
MESLDGLPVRRLISPFGTNSVYLHETPRGEASVLKVYRSRKAALCELRALRLVHGQDVKLNVPQVRRAKRRGDGSYMVTLSFFPNMTAWDVQTTGESGPLHELKTALTSLHNAKPRTQGWGTVNRNRFPTWWRFLEKRLDNRRPKLEGSGRIPPEKVKHLTDEIRYWEKQLTHVSPSLLHGDLNGSNILVGPNAEIVLIDFERALIGHSLYDLAKLWVQVFKKEKAVLDFLLQDHELGSCATNLFTLYVKLYAAEMAAYLLDNTYTDEDRDLLDVVVEII